MASVDCLFSIATRVSATFEASCVVSILSASGHLVIL